MRQYGDERWGKRTGVKSGVSAERGETCGRAWRVAVAFARALGSGVCGLSKVGARLVFMCVCGVEWLRERRKTADTGYLLLSLHACQASGVCVSACVCTRVVSSRWCQSRQSWE